MRPSEPTRAQSEVEAQEAAKSAFRAAACPNLGGRKGTRFSKCQEPAPRGRIGRGEDVAVVVDRHAATRGGAGDAGDQHRAAGVRLAPGRGAAGGVGRGEDVAASVAGGAEQGFDTQSTPPRSPAPSRCPHFRPGRGAAGRVGRDEDPPFPGDGDAERRGAAGDAAGNRASRRAGSTCHWPEAGIGRGQHLAARDARLPPETAAQKDGEGQETAVRCVAPCRRFVDDRRRPGAGAAGRFGRDVDEAFVADRDAEALRGAGDRLQPAARCRGSAVPLRRR